MKTGGQLIVDALEDERFRDTFVCPAKATWLCSMRCTMPTSA